MFMFSKPHSWKDLSDQNKAIVKKLTKDKASDAFIEAFNTGNHALALFLFREAQKTIRPEHLFCCLESICQKTTGDATLLKDLLDATPLYFLNDFPLINSQRSLFFELAKTDFVEGWKVLEEWHAKRAISSNWFRRHQFVDEVSRVEIAGRCDARHILVHALAENANLVQDALTGALAQEPGHTSLQWLIAKYTPTRQLLTKVLCDEAITNGDDRQTLDKIDVLLAHGAEVTNDTLLTAFKYEGRVVFFHLLPHWKYNEDGEKLMLLEISSLDELKLIEKILAEKKGETCKQEDRFTAPTPDILVETLQLPDGGKLTKIFNFSERRQYTSMTAQGLPPSTPAMIDFEDISNQEIIRHAAEILLLKGGDKAVVNKALAYQRPLRIGKD